MEKFFSAGIAILIFALVALFGFALMPAGHTHIFCPAKQVMGKECAAADPLAVLSFHTGAFKSFLSGVFGASVLSALLIFAAVSSALSVFPVAALLLSPVRIRRYSRNEDFIGTLAGRRFIDWLSFREHSPSSF